MTTTATIEKTEVSTSQDAERQIHRQACAYLKGYIVGYSQRNGMKWEGDKERTPEFAKGFEDSIRRDSENITFAHIIYNWIRHDRPHLGTEERDELFVQENRWTGNKMLAQLAEYGLDINEVLK